MAGRYKFSHHRLQTQQTVDLGSAPHARIVRGEKGTFAGGLNMPVLPLGSWSNTQLKALDSDFSTRRLLPPDFRRTQYALLSRSITWACAIEVQRVASTVASWNIVWPCVSGVHCNSRDKDDPCSVIQHRLSHHNPHMQ